MLDYGDVHMMIGKELMSVCLANDWPIIIKGLPRPNLEGKTDWTRFTVLGSEPSADVQNYNHWIVELAITSLKAHLREDGKFGAPYEIWKTLKPYMHRKEYVLNNTCIRSKEVTVKHLDNRTIGQNFDGASVTNPDSNTHTLLAVSTFVEISAIGG